MTLISENNRQYYAGTQTFIADGVNFDFTTTFNTDLVFATADPTNVNWPTNNFYLEVSIDGGLTYTPLYNTYTVSGNTITVTAGDNSNLNQYLQVANVQPLLDKYLQVANSGSVGGGSTNSFGTINVDGGILSAADNGGNSSYPSPRGGAGSYQLINVG